MGFRRLDRLIIILLFFLVVPIFTVGSEAYNSPEQVQIDHLKDKIEILYDNGINRMAMGLDIFVTVLTVLGLLGFGGLTAWVFRLRKKINIEVTRMQTLNQDLEKYSTTLQKYKKRMDELEERNKKMLIAVEEIFMAHISEQTLDKSVTIFDTSQKQRTVSEIKFLIEQGSPITEEILSVKAKMAYYDQDYETSVTLYKEIIEHFHGAPIYFYNIGFIYQAQSKNQLGKKYYQQAIDLDASFINAYLNLGVIEMAEGNTSKAVEYYSKAIELNPNNIKPWINLAAIMLDTNELKSAEMALDHVEKIDNCDVDYLYNRAILEIKKGNIEESIDFIERIPMTAFRKNQILSDDDFTPVFENPRFKEILGIS